MTQAQVLVSTATAGTELPEDAPRYSLLLARDSAEVVAAQRLRYQVFAGEMGAKLHTSQPGLDVDEFDEHCDHLVVREDRTGEIVSTYRMLPPDRAAQAGRLYSSTEFDLTAIEPLLDQVVETGRSCVHPDHRTGAVVSLMWAGIARYMLLTGRTMLAGCASVPLGDGGALAAAVWNMVRENHMSPPEYRVRPLHPWQSNGVRPAPRTLVPPLLKGYLRLGAWVCGPPALDADFGVADLFVLLDIAKVDPRYIKFFLGEQG
jgi:putative hemolysin